MKDKILDKIFKISRLEKEILYDNFDEVCKIIGIKTAQTKDEETGVIETPETSISEEVPEEEYESVLTENFSSKAEEYAEYISKSPKFRPILEKINKIKESLFKLNEDTSIVDEKKRQEDYNNRYKKLERSLFKGFDESYEEIKDFIALNDEEFFIDIIDNRGEEDTAPFKGYINDIVRSALNKTFGQPEKVIKAPQISYNEYISLLAYKVSQDDLISFKKIKSEKQNNPLLEREYQKHLFTVSNGLRSANEELSQDAKNADSSDKVQNILDNNNLEEIDILIEQIIKILGHGIPVEKEMENPDEYVQQHMEEMKFSSTGEPFEKEGQWYQVYGHVWTIPIKTKKDKDGKIVPDVTIDSATGEQIVYPLIDIEPIENIHNVFVSDLEFGAEGSGKDLISRVKNIFLDSESFSKYDHVQNQILYKLWNLYRENPQKVIEQDYEIFNKYRSFDSLEKSSADYRSFLLMIKEEDMRDIIYADVDEATGDHGQLWRFFENLKYFKNIIRDISGYAARANVASCTNISPNDYNFIIAFCENFYGKDLELLNAENYQTLGDIVRNWKNGENFGELDSQIQYISERVVPNVIEARKNTGEEISFEKALEILDTIFDPQKIRYFKNVKDRANDFAEQQELSHHSSYSYHGKSNFCRFCGRFRGVKRQSRKYGGADTVNLIDGEYYFKRPETDKDIVLSPADVEHMDSDTLSKYFKLYIKDESGEFTQISSKEEAGDKLYFYIQNKCDFQENQDGTIFGSCDIVSNVLFEGFARAPSINEVFNRNVPIVMDGETLQMRTGRTNEDGEPEIVPIQLNERENELVQTFTSVLLDDYLEKITEYHQDKPIKALLPRERVNEIVGLYKSGSPQLNSVLEYEGISKSEFENFIKIYENGETKNASEVSSFLKGNVSLDRGAIREALKDYLEYTTSRISDSVLSLEGSKHQGGDDAIEYAFRSQRSSSVLFSALEAYNYNKYLEEIEGGAESLDENKIEKLKAKAQFFSGADVLQLFACGASATNKTMLKSTRISGGSGGYNIPLTDDELNKVVWRDAWGKPVMSQDGEKELTIREFLKDIKKIPFGETNLPSEESVSMGFLFAGEGTGSSYSKRVGAVENFANEALKKAHALEIYALAAKEINNPNISVEDRETTIQNAWKKIMHNSDLYKKVKIPAYATKPEKEIIDKDGNRRLNLDYEQQLCNWVRQHFVEGHVQPNEKELAFYALDPSRAGDIFISIMDNMFSTFDFDMPYKGTSNPTDTDIEVFLQEKTNLPKVFFGFSDKEYNEAMDRYESEEFQQEFLDYTRKSVDWMPMPQKGDLIRIKEENSNRFNVYSILDLVEHNIEKNSNPQTGVAKYLAVPGVAYKESAVEKEKINKYEIEEGYDFDVYFDSIENPEQIEIETLNNAIDRRKYHVMTGAGANYMSDSTALLTARFKDKYYYMGSDKDRKKFVEAAIARWIDSPPSGESGGVSGERTKIKNEVLERDQYKDIYRRRKDLAIFSKYYAYYKFREKIQEIKASGQIASEEVASTAFEQLDKELSNNYSSQRSDLYKNREDNKLLLKQKIHQNIIQISILESMSFPEIEEDLGISIDQFFGGIENYNQVEETVIGDRAEYLPSFFPNLPSAKEDLQHFSKSGVASVVCDSGTGGKIGKSNLLGHLTGFDENEDPVTPQEKILLTYKAFTTLTEKMMKLSLLNKDVSSKIYDYVEMLQEKGGYAVSFTPKINQLLGLLGLNMLQSANYENAERPATITRALLLYSNAQRGSIPNRNAGFYLGGAGVDYNETENRFTYNQSPIQIMLQGIPNWGMGGVSFVEGMNRLIQGASPSPDSSFNQVMKQIQKSKKANINSWYKFTENKDVNYTGEFAYVVITSHGDIMNSVKNSQLTSKNKLRVLPYLKIVPYENFGSIKRILDFKKRTGYNATVITDAEYGFLSQVGLITNA